MHRFPIALHPIRPKTYGSNDSGQVLALPPNRGASDPAQRFRRGCPFRQALRDFAGTTRRASHGPRSSTKIFFENSTGRDCGSWEGYPSPGGEPKLLASRSSSYDQATRLDYGMGVETAQAGASASRRRGKLCLMR